VCECSELNLPARNESKVLLDLGGIFAPSTDHDPSSERFECEHTCWDPKDAKNFEKRVKKYLKLLKGKRSKPVS